MTRKRSFRKYLNVLFFTFLTVSLNAQPTITDVINAFNAGAEEVNASNFEGAIARFEETISLAGELGAEGDEMKARAKGQIPPLHYRMAMDRYKAKDLPGAIAKFEAAVETGDKYENPDIKEKSLKYIPQLYNAVGNSQVKSEEYDAAVASFDKAIEYQPDYARAYYGKGLVYLKQKDTDNMVATLEKAAEVANAGGDSKTAGAATKVLKDYFVNTGMTVYKADDYEGALKSFETALKYDPEDPDPYYLSCVIYGKQENFEKAVEYGLKAAQYEEAADQAKIWYEVGNAYVRLVEYEKACDAFSKAQVEPYLNSVQYQMDNVLKCL